VVFASKSFCVRAGSLAGTIQRGGTEYVMIIAVARRGLGGPCVIVRKARACGAAPQN
jgi:hypothetical protein